MTVKRRRQGMAEAKFECRNPKFETNSKFEIPMYKTKPLCRVVFGVWNTRISDLFLISCFGFRISNIRASYARQGVRRLVANVVGRGFVLDSDSGDKAIDDVNGYRWESVVMAVVVGRRPTGEALYLLASKETRMTPVRKLRFHCQYQPLDYRQAAVLAVAIEHHRDPPAERPALGRPTAARKSRSRPGSTRSSGPRARRDSGTWR